MKRVVFLGLVGLLLALPLSAAAGDPYGSLTLVQERRAGFLEECDALRLAERWVCAAEREQALTVARPRTVETTRGLPRDGSRPLREAPVSGPDRACGPRVGVE